MQHYTQHYAHQWHQFATAKTCLCSEHLKLTQHQSPIQLNDLVLQTCVFTKAV